MKKHKFKKVYIIVTIVFIIVTIFLIASINKESNPFTPIAEMRNNVEDYEAISTKETENGTIVYSVGKVNNGLDNMYFVDMVQKTFMGYKWLGGGGHINRDIGRQNGNFILSAQLLNEEQNINPTLFGIFLNENIRKVTVDTRSGLSNATIYNGKEKNEKIYVVQFKNDVSDYQNFMLIITFKDGSRLDYVVPKEKITRFQEGHQIYFYK